MREDITMLQRMIDAGWTPVYNSQDILYKRTDSPHHGISYSKGTIRIWECRADYNNTGWQIAELIDGVYKNHRGGNNIKKYAEDDYRPLGNRLDRGINGFIPDLETILELEKAGDL